jgi:DNA/RNA endonuclease G (NUC1)
LLLYLINLKSAVSDNVDSLDRTLSLYGQASTPIYRRLGDLLVNQIPGSDAGSKTWYTPDHTLATRNGVPIPHGDDNAVWEGIGTGWFYSVLGGGYARRPYQENGIQLSQLKLSDDYFKQNRSPVTEDNTYTNRLDTRIDTRMRGDYAVPTLFNGNFDAVAFSAGANQAIPGWGNTSQNNLVNINTLPSLNAHLTKLGSNRAIPNYAVELTSGESVTHNPFVVPDWGALRFDLHTDDVSSISLDTLTVTLQTMDGKSITQPIYLREAIGTASEYANDRWRIGYGETGFETFTIDVPDEFRGKVATVSFELSGGNPVYLDNVFFKSQHLLLGNPTEARTPDGPISNLYYNNYLLEKPQYAVSYSGDSHIPNWSVWQVNKTWVGSERPRDYFFRDPQLESLGLVSAKDEDYERPLSNIIPGPTQPDGQPYKLAPGHLAPNADRGRNLKDSISTFLTSNIVPQHGTHNNSIWRSLELFTRNLATQQSREIYVYAGGVGEKNPYTDKANITVTNDSLYGNYNLQVPSHLWKTFLILETPSLSVQDITAANATAFAVWTENTLPEPGQSPYTRWNEGGMEIITVGELERRLNGDANNQARGVKYNFFSNLSSSVQQMLKITPVIVPPGTSPHTAFLMAESSQLTDLDIISSDTTVWHNSVVEDRIFKPGNFTGVSPNQVRLSEVSVAHASPSEISPSQTGIGQVGTVQNSVSQISFGEVSILQVSPVQGGLPEIGIPKVSPTKVDFLQKHLSNNSSAQIHIAQGSSAQFVRTFDIDSTEISFPSSITLQQLFSSHNRPRLDILPPGANPI